MKSIKVPIYGYKLHISIGDDYKKVVSTINRRTKSTKLNEADLTSIKDALNTEHTLGFFLDLYIHGNGLIWLNPKLNPNSTKDFITLSHEMNHAAIQIFSYIGSSVNKETEEPFCYLHDHLTEVCLEELEKRKKDGHNNTKQDKIGVTQELVTILKPNITP